MWEDKAPRKTYRLNNGQFSIKWRENFRFVVVLNTKALAILSSCIGGSLRVKMCQGKSRVIAWGRHSPKIKNYVQLKIGTFFNDYIQKVEVVSK